MVNYTCKGSCKGAVSEEEFNAGKNKCATQGCTNFGQPLVPETAVEQTEAPKQ